MPELPEVETVCRDLNEVLTGDEIVALDIRLPKIFRAPASETVEGRILNRRIGRVHRRAKLIVFDLDNDWHLIVHLKMTGQLLWSSANELIAGGHTMSPAEVVTSEPTKYTHAIFTLKSGGRLLFNDLRQFGYIELADERRWQELKDAYGPEPLSDDFLLSGFMAALARRSRSSIKAALLDQKVLAGLGNIYVDEVCWRSGIRPTRLVGDLSEEELGRLFVEIPPLLQEAIAARGTTFNSYRDGKGRQGSFVSKLAVYGRGGESCRRCGKLIEKTKLVGRGTHYCPGCQR